MPTRTRILPSVFVAVSLTALGVWLLAPLDAGMNAKANLTTAVQTLQRISGAQQTYKADHFDKGFACSFNALADDFGEAERIRNISADLSDGKRGGYAFRFAACSTDGRSQVIHYKVIATPLRVGITGYRGLCMDETGAITSDPTGGTNCTQLVK